MNIHHLELFYYVAKFGGISEAVRNMPYGIQQPAISGQVLQLEDDLGVTLFQRRPFALTPAGQELFEFIQPFFDNLEATAEKLRGGASQHIRIAASAVVLEEHLPELLRELRRQFPRLKLSLHEALQPDIELWLQRRQIDLAVTVIEGKAPATLRREVLLELPLVLLVEKGSRIKSAGELWRKDRIEETLIIPTPNEAITRHFQRGLNRLGVDWPPGIVVNSLALIEHYVANGFGVGVSVAVPRAVTHRKIRALPLPDFAPIAVGAVWQGKLNPVMNRLVEEMRRYAGSLREGE